MPCVFSIKKQLKNGFSITELIVVIVVIGILTSISVVGYTGWRKSVNDAKLKNELIMAASALDSYRNYNNQYPDSISGVYEPGDGVTINYVKAYSGESYQLTAKINSGNSQGYFLNSGSTVKESKTCPEGFIFVPGNPVYKTDDGFCVMKYEAKNNGSNIPVSTASGSPWANITYTDALAYSQTACDGCHLMKNNEWMTIATNVMSVNSNWCDPSGTCTTQQVGNGFIFSGHNDALPNNPLTVSNPNDGYSDTGSTSFDKQRRTLKLTTGEEIWDLSGNVYEIMQETINRNNTPYLTTDVSCVTSCASWVNLTETNINFDENYITRSNALPAEAMGFSVSNGIGKMYYSYNPSDSGARTYIRGGGYGSTSGAGIFNLNFSFSTTSVLPSVGFRVTK